MAESRTSRRSGPRWALATIRVFTVLSVLAVLAAGMWLLQNHVLASQQYAGKSARVVLDNRPDWLPDDIAARIGLDLQCAISGRSIYDDDLAQRVYQAAARSPWVAGVSRVAKSQDGVVHVSADFRRPFALVTCSQLRADDFRVVDEQGVVLPLPAERIKKGTFVTVTDVLAEPPPPGRNWPGADLADGLRLLKLVLDKPYAGEIAVIDVSNHGGRLFPDRPHLRMWAQGAAAAGTDIRFGRFPASDGIDWFPTAEHRLELLDGYYRLHNGRLTGANTWIDLQYGGLYGNVN